MLINLPLHKKSKTGEFSQFFLPSKTKKSNRKNVSGYSTPFKRDTDIFHNKKLTQFEFWNTLKRETKRLNKLKEHANKVLNTFSPRLKSYQMKDLLINSRREWDMRVQLWNFSLFFYGVCSLPFFYNQTKGT